MSSFGIFLRHQLGAIVTTAVDFSTMIAWVELVHGSPVTGTALGASAGALTNFTLGRHWIFAAHGGSVSGQVLRYAMVSASSLGWNTLGQDLIRATGLPYPVTRTMIAIAVGVCWNYPLQRWFVFQKRNAPPATPTEPV